MAAARSHRPARTWPPPAPCPLPQHPKPAASARSGASRVLPATHPGSQPGTPAGGIAIPPAGVQRGGMLRARVSTGSSAGVRLLRGDFCKLGARQDDGKAPREGASLCPPPAPAPVPAWWDAGPASGQAGTRGDLPRQPAADPALVTAAVKGD